MEGHLQKMVVDFYDADRVVEYRLPLDSITLPLNECLGKRVRLEYKGEIQCLNCGRKAKKSFNQGYCYPCFTKLACCDSCIVSPEKCHFENGTCREEDWARDFCMTDHYVYLANSTGVKVGITRATQIPTRWVDQGAIQALPLFKVKDRFLSGLVEVIFKTYVTDKTNWRNMLKGNVEPLDMESERDSLMNIVKDRLDELQSMHGLQAIQFLPDAEVVSISSPVLEYPIKVTSLNFDKTPVVEGQLMGIKGQYLILDTGVINIRKFGAYKVAFSVEE